MQCILETDINSDSNKVTMVVDGDQKNNVGRSASQFGGAQTARKRSTHTAAEGCAGN